MELWQLGIYFVAAFVASVLSGIAGSGGGFIITPVMIFLGLTPAQAVSTSMFQGVIISMSSLAGMRSEHGKLSRWKVIPVMALALVIGLITPLIITGFESDLYRITLGSLLILMIPVMLVKKMGLEPHHPTTAQKVGGSILLTLALFLQGIFAGGLGTLVNIVLMGMLGMTATEANITKRWSQLILAFIIVISVMAAGLIRWEVVAAGIVPALVGGYLGGHMAVKRGNLFIVRVLAALMLASGLALIFGA